MVTTNRKLQTEIDRLLKKVSEGIEDFDEILKKVHGAVNPNQKEKYEAELKKEIKKLQRYRDQIKSWCTSSEIKNKAPLVDARKVIESRMELFKQCERETKTKPYSKEALARTEEMTEEDRSRGETAAWITRSIEELQQQIDACEAELETTRRRRGDSRAATLARSVERHRFHIDRLELMLRLLHNERLTPEQISDVRDGVDYYIQANAEEEFLEDDTLYESLGLFDEDEDGDGGSSSDASGDDGAADAAAPATDAAASEAEAKTAPPAAAVASPPMSPQKHPALPALPTLASAAASAVAAAAAHGHKAPAASAPSAAAAAEKGKPKPAAAPAASAQPAAAKQQAKPQSQSPPQQQPVQQKPQATAAQIVARSLSGSGSSSPPVAPAPAPALVPAPAQKAAPAPPQQQPPLPPSQPKPAAPAPAPVAASAPRPVPPPAQQKPAVAQPPPSPKRLSVSRGSGSGELPPAETLPAAHAMSTSAPSQPTAAVQAPAAAPAPAPAPLAFLLEKHAFLQQLAMQPKEPAPQQQQPAAPRQESGGLPFQTLAQMTAAQQVTRMHSSSPPAIATQAAPAPAPAQPKRAYMPYVPAGMRPLVQSPPPTAAAPVASPPPSQPPVTATAPAATVPATTSAPSQPSSAPAHVPQQPSHPATYLPPVAQAVASAVAAVQSPPTLAPAPAPAPPTTTPPVPTAATGPASQGAAVPSVAVVPQRALPRPVAPTESHDLPSFLEASMANQSRFPGEAERARTYTPRRELTAMPSWFPTTPLSSLCTPAHMAKLDPDTLFFIFYYQQNTYQQYLAAQELKRQAWRYHKKYLTWFQRHDEPREITADHETGTYIYFDYETDWCQRMKADFTFEYRFLEE